eukprot:SAG22_NODE_96_length_20771_cov_33.186018_9_plen_101_part_00
MLRAESFSCAAPLVTVLPHSAAKVCVLLLPTAENAADEAGTMATCEAAHEGLDELNLDLSLSCRFLTQKTAVVVVVRNHGAQNMTLAPGRALAVVRRYLV